MAVAPLESVRRVLDYAVSEIPADKIYMGLPNYGYDWTLPYKQGETRAKLVGNEEAVRRAGIRPPEIFTMGQALDKEAYCYTVDEFVKGFGG